MKLEKKEQVIEACERFWSPSAALLYRLSHKTLESHAKGSWVFDEEGERYLDFACSYGVFVVGHGNPEVKQAAREQLSTMAAKVPGLANVPMLKLMRELSASLPADLERCWFTSTGAEACELAVRAAFMLQQRKKLVVIENSYHGKTLGALGFLGQSAHRLPFGKLMRDIEYVAFGDVEALERAVGDGAAAVLVEPVLGGPFLQVAPAGYLTKIRQLCDQTQTLMITDEIQTGLGRAGRLYAIDYEKVVPDMTLLSKGLTGGYSPFAALVMRQKTYQNLLDSELYDARLLRTSNGASAYSCAVALAALRFIKNNKLAERSALLGERLLTGLKRIASRYPDLIVEARGIGLMTGLKLRNSAVESAVSIIMNKEGVHTGHSLNESIDQPILRFYPPLTVSEDEIDFCLDKLELAMSKLAKRPLWLLDLFDKLARRQYKIPPRILYKLSGIKPSRSLAL
ncbi:aspartate aminotransferase family protein [Agaribacterium haliotis]|uniref:class-III pyridoxal-phosphate-dependent aminotransferase n=1 Tax=Agaribacterium haliotis TaxID=2013869 RepID=UPI000BB59FA8|nr:aspartate aminotransferase family protein [Agaribacterium haliotis]